MTVIAATLIILALLSAPLALAFTGLVAVRAPRDFRKVLPFFILAVSVFAYSYEPTYENDLARYFAEISSCAAIPFSEALNWKNDGLFVKNLLFWLIGQTGDCHLLPAVSSGVLYGVTAYITMDSSSDVGMIWRILLFQLLAIPPLEATSNVRNMIAFALLCLAVYRDLKQKNRGFLTMLLYVLPCFIHMTGIVIILFRIAVPLVKKYPVAGTIATVGVPSVTLMGYYLIKPIVEIIPGNFGLVINRAVWKAYTSTIATSDYAVAMRNSGYEQATALVALVMFAILALLAMRFIRDHREESLDYIVFSLIIFDITAIWAALLIIKFWVFAVAGVIASAPLLSRVFSALRGRNLFSQACIAGLWGAALARSALEVYFMSSRLDFGSFVYGIFTNNVFVITQNLLLNLA